MAKVTIVEVGLRDGLQAEKVSLPLQDRVLLAKLLVKAGVPRLELGSFVRPDWVPQMAQTDRVVKAILPWASRNGYRAQFSVLVPNLKGLEGALAVKIPEIALFASVSEGFSKANLNASTREVWQRLEEVAKEARKHKLKMRGYLSVVFGCPFDGEVKIKDVIRSVEKFLELGVYEISLGDTIGAAGPGDVEKVLSALFKLFGEKKFAGHFHDTRGQAVANVLRAFQMGMRVFDSSFAGLGGCPYAPASTGNVATEELCYLFESLKIKTQISIPQILAAGKKMEAISGRKLPSRLFRAGLPKFY